MAYVFQPGAPLAGEVQRIAAEELDSAIGQLAKEPVDDSAVHEVRKHMKKMRGLLRLLRGPLGRDYAVCNALCRDVGRCLSGVRDADVMLETLAWMAQSGRPVDSTLLRQCERHLQQHREVVRAQSGDMQESLRLARQGLLAMAERVAGWSLDEEGEELLKGGLKRIYKQARGHCQLSMIQPSDEHFHDWRKRVKYHWYHCRLLEPLAAGFLAERTRRLKSLSDIIGREHDLTVLRDFLSDRQEKIMRRLRMLEILEVNVILLGQQREQAWRLGGELFAQPAGYWTGQCLKAMRTSLAGASGIDGNRE